MKNDELMSVYLQLRDRRAQRKKAFEVEDESDKSYQEKIEAMFLKQFNVEGTDSVTCRGVGTAYKKTNTYASVADWGILLPFIREHELWQLLPKSVSKSAVEEYVAANEELPPGVNVRRELVVNIQRAN